jgi:hypothetical protein
VNRLDELAELLEAEVFKEPWNPYQDGETLVFRKNGKQMRLKAGSSYDKGYFFLFEAEDA